ncbi:MAG: hypothetical protein Q9196_003475, partial [Gyalolechia fulgens]
MTMDANGEQDWSTLDACYQQPRRSNFPINCTLELRHPGLPDNGGSNILFRFPAYDRNGGGLHHSIALTACAIVAGNKFAGYLSSTATGPPVAEALNAVLPGPCYYFHPHPKQAGKSESPNIIRARLTIKSQLRSRPNKHIVALFLLFPIAIPYLPDLPRLALPPQ